MSGIKELQNSFINFLGETDRSKNDKLPNNYNGITSSLFPKKGEWLESVNGKIVSQIGVPPDKPMKESFWVGFPLPKFPPGKAARMENPTANLPDRFVKLCSGKNSDSVPKILQNMMK